MSLWNDEQLADLAGRHGTPLYVYDRERILAQAARLARFDVVRFAQKANSNIGVLRVLAGAGLSVDAVSAGELQRARLAGFEDARIEATADLFDRTSLAAIAASGVRVNVGSPDVLESLAAAAGSREITLRVNPGFGHGHTRQVTTGGPHSKHGIWHTELEDAFARAQAAGHRVTGLHMHIGSGADFEHLARCVEAMGALLERAPASVVRASAGGGLPVPYREGEDEFPVEAYTDAWLAGRARWQERLGRELELEVEPGRYLVAQAGVLLCEVRATKRTSEYPWVLVDAGFHTLARPMIYGAYHRVRALGIPADAPTRPQVVAGPLCESSDVLTQDASGEPAPQPLPELAPGHLLAIHDAGAYGMGMASNYNGFPLPAEVLIEDGAPRLVRRRQTLEELLAPEVDCLEQAP